ncbi:MFS transporter [Cellulomonas telluris]|uniref:MFS transporter n=1 Tax=Cellulomonas telluris TaxID=2306636 RepID=UPI003520885C
MGSVRSQTPGTDTVVRTARVALLAQFALFGVIGPSWMSRLPSIRESLGVSTGTLGALLVAGAAGALVTLLLAGAVVGRLGTRRTVTVATAGGLAGLGLVAAGTALGSVPVFAVGALLNGASGALVNVPINLDGAAVERRLGRTVLPHMHAAFSVGAALGALVGAASSAAGVPVSVHVLVIAVLVAAGRLATVRPATALDAGPSSRAERAARGAARGSALGAWAEPRTLLIGVVLLASALAEGSAANWLSLAVATGLDQPEAVGALAYGSFVTAMTVVRLTGTRLVDRFGRVAVLRTSQACALAGLLLFCLAPTLPLAWLGIVAWGVGAALPNPLAVAAAADEPERAAARVAVATSFSSFAQLTAPPLIGLLAEEVGGVRPALLPLTVVIALGLLVADRVRPIGGRTSARTSPEAAVSESSAVPEPR